MPRSILHFLGQSIIHQLRVDNKNLPYNKNLPFCLAGEAHLLSLSCNKFHKFLDGLSLRVYKVSASDHTRYEKRKSRERPWRQWWPTCCSTWWAWQEKTKRLYETNERQRCLHDWHTPSQTFLGRYGDLWVKGRASREATRWTRFGQGADPRDVVYYKLDSWCWAAVDTANQTSDEWRNQQTYL